MIDSLNSYLVAGKNEFLPQASNEILVSNNVETKDNNTMTIFNTDKLPDELSTLYSPVKNKPAEKANDNETKSVWERVKSFVKDNLGTTVCAATSAFALGIGIPAIIAGFVTVNTLALGIVGVVLTGATALVAWDNHYSQKDNQKYYSEMKTLTEDKNKEPDKKALDSTLSKKVEASISSREFASFKIPNGTMTQTLKMPMALDMNKILEKYSDEKSPEISENEQKSFLTDVDKFFSDLKEKTNHSIACKEYSFGQYNITDAQKELEKIKGNVQQLIEKTTDEKSPSGKAIDKNELLKLRQQIFLSLNN